MALQKPVVLSNGELQRLQPGDSLDANVTTYSKTFTSTSVPGQAVYADGNTSVDLAQANAESTADVVGISVAGVTSASSGDVQYSGVLTLTTGEWDAVAGTTGGLTAGTKYFLSDTSPGDLLEQGNLTGITQGEYIVELGMALSTTEMLVMPRSKILM